MCVSPGIPVPRSSYTADLTVRPALESETRRMSAALSDNFNNRFSLQKWFIQGLSFLLARGVLLYCCGVLLCHANSVLENERRSLHVCVDKKSLVQVML